MTNLSVAAIVGPTAVGKSSTALRVAEQLLTSRKATEVHLVSVDSRQVYADIAVLSGADVPVGFSQQSAGIFPFAYFQRGQLLIHGVGIRAADQDWSVGQFRDFVWQLLSVIPKQSVVFFVGGSGLYHRATTELAPQLSIGPNQHLRTHLAEFDLAELQAQLRQLDAVAWQQLSESDRLNPRRLVRKIELAEAAPNKQVVSIPEQVQQLARTGYPQYGLTLSAEQLRENISVRVAERISSGAVDEVQQLIAQKQELSAQLTSATGFTELAQYLAQQVDLAAAKQRWITREYQYAKRQLTWWKKYGQARWYLDAHALVADCVAHFSA